VSQWEVSRSWVERFLKRNPDQLSPKYTTSIDRNRFKADTEHSYRTYFDLLYAKMRQYNVDAENVYNMDEKGFLLGKTSRTERIFSKQFWEQKKVTAALQDGSTEWITVLAAICADGSWVDPAVIFEAKGELRDAWLRDVDAQKHQVFSQQVHPGGLITRSGWPGLSGYLTAVRRRKREGSTASSSSMATRATLHALL
jgi:leucyl aminopeptidase (aminopeptidase T)